MRGNFNRLAQKVKHSFLYQFVFFVLVMLILLICYLVVGNQIKSKKFDYVQDDFSWVYQIDSVEKIGNKAVFIGWAFKLNEEAAYNYEIILYNTRTKQAFFPKIEYVERQEVNNYFSCEYDYSNSGFVATIPLSKLSLDSSTFCFLLRPKNEKTAYYTDMFCVNGEMVYTNPKKLVELDVQGTDLEVIVKEGILKAYRSNIGMSIYQYKGDLYWIVPKEYLFENDNQKIELQLQTTQGFKLPESRQKYGSDNLGFSFESCEILEWNTGAYRVAKCELPTEYSITEILTGEYTTKWLWSQRFRPYYDFANEVK